MQIAIIENGSVKQIGDYKQLFPNTSFPSTGPSQDWMEDQNCMIVTVWKSHDSTTQKLVPTDPYIEDGQVFTVTVASKTQEELDTQTASLAAQVRAQRNALLAQSDWTQGKDIPDELSSAWAVYRQELRDITSQEGFPSNVQFPSSPAQ